MLDGTHSSRVGNRVLPAVLALVVGSAATACGGKENGAVVSTVGGSSEHRASGGAGATALLASGGASATIATGGSVATGGSSTKASAPSIGGATGGVSSTTRTGGSSATGGAVGSSLAGAQAVQAFTTSYVAPYCARLANCCTQAGYPAPTGCANTELGYYSGSLADGSGQVNSAGVAALLNAIQNKCDQPSYTLYSNLTAGTRPIGSDCTDVSQCQGDSVACLIASTASVGKCVALTRGKSGDPCAVGCDNTSSCRWTINGGNATQAAACWDEDGLRCDSGTNTCVAMSGIGNSCDFTCGVHADCLNGVCVAKGKLAGSCSNNRSCESTLICNSSYICEKMSIAWSGSCGS